MPAIGGGWPSACGVRLVQTAAGVVLRLNGTGLAAYCQPSKKLITKSMWTLIAWNASLGLPLRIAR